MPPTGTQQTPPLATAVVRIGGDTWEVASDDLARKAGGRAWVVETASEQELPSHALTIPLETFHYGSGFSYMGMPGVYDYADGWDASAPGRIRTWARHATATQVASTGSTRGWLRFFNGQLWMFRGSKVTIYTVSDTAGAGWTGSTFDLVSDWSLAANSIVGGRPDFFEGKLYIPTKSSSTGVYGRFVEVTPGAPLVVTQGPTSTNAGYGLRCFRSWRKPDTGPVLVGGDANGVRTCATTPTTSANWSALTEADATDFPVTDLAVWQRYLAVATKRGLYTFNEYLVAENQLPDLFTELDETNGQGMEYSNGYLLIPHKSGLIRWAPGTWGHSGPEQEHATEPDLSEGWGRVRAVVPHGPTAYVTTNDATHTTASVNSLRPQRSAPRGPLVPHCHHQVAGTLEDACVVNNSSDTYSYLAVLQVASNGTDAQPYIYRLPRSGLTPADDPNVTHAIGTAATFYTSRVVEPGWEYTKTYREVRFYLEASVSTGAGVKVYASVDNGSFVQLTTASGSTSAITATGFQRLFFPKTSAAVGRHVRLKFAIAAKAGAETDAAYTIRGTKLRAAVRSLRTDRLSCVLVLRGQGTRPDTSRERRTVKEQVADLRALDAPNTAPVAYRDIDNMEGYLTVESVLIREVDWAPGMQPVKVATLTAFVEDYT